MFYCRKVFLGGLLFLMPIGVWAQGILEGKIIDSKTKEPLIGATIMVNDTPVAGISDANGDYSLSAIPSGTYLVNVRYVSYQTTQLDHVIIGSGITRLDVEMNSAELQLKDVMVVATRRTNTELSMLNQTKISPLVISGISSQQISKTLDRDAGEVIKRVPGVTIMGDRFIVVRGLSQRYNNVWINDVSTPSSEADSRAFSFDVIPAGQIDNMVVYKSPAPEIPADFSGGFVKIETKNMPENNSLQISFTTGYQEGSTFEPYISSSYTVPDLLGLGYSARALPDNFPAKIVSSMSKSTLASCTESINRGWGTSQKSALPDLRLSMSFNRIFNWGNVKVGTTSALNFSNIWRTYEIPNNRYGIYQKSLDTPSIRNEYNDRQYNQDSRFAIMNNWSFVLNPKNRIEFRNFLNQMGKNRYTWREGEDRSNDYSIRETEMMYNSRTSYSGQLSGKHRFAGDKTKLDWVTGYSYANQYSPDRKIITSRLNDEITSPYFGQYGTDGNDVKRNFQNLGEHVFSNSVNLEQKLSIGTLTPTLKTGIQEEYKTRSFDARNFIYSYKTDLLPKDFVYSSYTDMFTVANIQSNGVLLKENTNKSDSYSATSQLLAGYVGLNIPFGWLDIYAGVRAEFNNLRLDGYESDGTDPVNVNRQNLDFFPSVNATCHLNDKNQLRLAYGRSVNRPEFREIAPYVYYDFDQFTNFEGNSSLKNAYIHNIELRYEYYPTPTQSISVAAFYKNFSNPIEITYFEVGGQQQYTYQNAVNARNYGLELENRMNLMDFGLKNFNLVLNGSLIQSKVLFAKGSFERNRAMQGQSPWLVNSGLYYDGDNSGWKGSLLYNCIGKRIVFVGIVNQEISEDIPDIYEMPHHTIDFSLSKKIGDKLELNLGIKNILNKPVEYKQFPRFADENGTIQKREQITRSYVLGRNIGLTLTMRL